jgi:microcystin degradation protein MlrC
MTFKVLTAEFLHETNTFSIRRTDIAAFEAGRLSIGDDGLEGFDGTNTGVAGCLECAATYGWHMTHAISALAGPSGLVTRSAFDTITCHILDQARKGTFDGVLLPLHGAMVTEDSEDGEGDLLRRLREVIGPDIPVAITLDLHANVTEQMCALAQIIVSYKTYPHIDMRETARHAGDILQRTMSGEIAPITLRAHRPMLVEANGGRTDVGPMIERLERARAYESQPQVYAVSINAGFENSDIAEVGPTVLVTCEGDLNAHQTFAEDIADDIWAKRADVINTYYTVDEVATIAADFVSIGDPLIIADYADNPGGGAYGDSTALLDAMLRHGVHNACFGPMVDPAVAKMLHEHEVGETVNVQLGGKTDPLIGGGPLSLSGKIRLLSNGECVGDGPMRDGQTMNFGKTCVLNVDGIDVLVVSEAMQMYDQQQFRAFGIDPSIKSVVALKSMQHFRAAFEPIAAKVITCDSGALCTTRFEELPFKNVPRPLYPLDPDMEL